MFSVSYTHLDVYKRQRFITEKNIPLQKTITHAFNLDQAKEAYELFDKRETGAVVIVNE